MNVRRFSVAREFSTTPGPRSPKEGPASGEALLQVLIPLFKEVVDGDMMLEVDLDGTAGYATSFLEAVFGGLARAFGRAELQRRLKIVSNDEPYLKEEVHGYINDVSEAQR
jgi:STAS-like domain of unknown function (DUF4325)